MRNRCGEILSQRDDVDVDSVAGVPDSGTAHAVGYANAKGIPLLVRLLNIHLPGLDLSCQLINLNVI